MIPISRFFASRSMSAPSMYLPIVLGILYFFTVDGVQWNIFFHIEQKYSFYFLIFFP